MPTVQTFSRAMIENYLRKIDLRYLTDRDGDFHVAFSYEADYGGSLTYLIMVEGKSSSILAVRIISDRRIAKSDWGRAVMACNTWNRERRWPKAYLIADAAEDDTGKISLDLDVDLEQGVHQELLDEMLDSVFFGGGFFWKWAHQEQGL